MAPMRLVPHPTGSGHPYRCRSKPGSGRLTGIAVSIAALFAIGLGALVPARAHAASTPVLLIRGQPRVLTWTAVRVRRLSTGRTASLCGTVMATMPGMFMPPVSAILRQDGPDRCFARLVFTMAGPWCVTACLLPETSADHATRLRVFVRVQD